MTAIDFPESIDGVAIPDGAIVRGGGTDVQERIHSHNLEPHIVDLTRIAGIRRIEQTDEGTMIGAGATVASVARALADTYPALAITASDLATPQIREIGTIGGNLMQHNRCWYYRHPDLDCGEVGACSARTGRHLYGVVFDTADCVHPHPSSLGMALLAYDATVTLSGGSTMSVADLMAAGRDPRSPSPLPAGEIIASVHVPAPWPDEKGAYFRAITRHLAEWPLVESAVRVRLDDDGTVADCALVVGGVAPSPLRLGAVEDALKGTDLSDDAIQHAAAISAEGANPLPETDYKVDVLVGTVHQVLDLVRDQS